MNRMSVEERTKFPGIFWVVRGIVWTASLAAIPFSGGGSLAGIAIFEGLAHNGRKEASQKVQERSNIRSEATREIKHDMLAGYTSSVRSFDTEINCFGTITTEYKYKSR